MSRGKPLAYYSQGNKMRIVNKRHRVLKGSKSVLFQKLHDCLYNKILRHLKKLFKLISRLNNVIESKINIESIIFCIIVAG